VRLGAGEKYPNSACPPAYSLPAAARARDRTIVLWGKLIGAPGAAAKPHSMVVAKYVDAILAGGHDSVSGYRRGTGFGGVDKIRNTKGVLGMSMGMAKKLPQTKYCPLAYRW